MANFTVAIIAGGKSSRMGTDKAFVMLNDKPLLQHVIDRTANLGQTETILITNKPDEYARFDLPMFTDVMKDKGSLGGIYTALRHSKGPFTLCIACDMPFVNPDLLRFMLSLINDETDVIVPRVDGYPEGLHAIYSQACIKPIETQLEAGKLRVIGFYPQVRVRYLDEADYAAYDPEKQSFQNLNTPEELEATRKKDQP